MSSTCTPSIVKIDAKPGRLIKKGKGREGKREEKRGWREISVSG